MKNFRIVFLFLTLVILNSCGKKTDKDRAIELVKSKYESGNQELNFENATLDSLYTISPKAYADSIKKGNELDTTLALLESEIEHLPQAESDSVGRISAELTKRRYRLIDLAKLKPQFRGWKLSGVKVEDENAEVLSFNFDKGITQIVE
ncbi:hypothetical protein [Pedobacter endophyticus]|uniref:Uncharacterized protein n=1 Tax=Pedobacter endophyticus TaxID=2789740 RepID=A0A7S9L318_9SPHI|nr:hypothetical protein [Pedobacter endophyticus]QPH41575.1 hypothetical protein IZT61_10105 [Pedobacter endophyticus]